MKKLFSIFLLALIFLFSCSAQESTVEDSGNHAPDHSSWTAILQDYAYQNGMVDYAGLVVDKERLLAYTGLLSRNSPSSSWDKNDELAYWINAYNAFTVLLIVENYPIESIKDLNPTISIPTIRSVWTKEWFQIGGKDFSLDRIEHKILRKKFEEPRIHFAINCASYSCPVLRMEAYTGAKIDTQLEEQAFLFINDISRNEIVQNEVKLSKLFNWFGGDFKKGQTLIAFINKYSTVKVNENAKIRFLDYGWALNDQSKKR
jgi:uncharacterized protein DUF547